MRIVVIITIVIGCLLFVLNWILAKEMNVLNFYNSEYVHTKTGYLTMLGFIITGIGILLSTNPLKTLTAINVKNNFMEISLVFYAFLFMLLAFFPADSRDSNTVRGKIHIVIAFICFLFFLIALFVAILLKKNPPSLDILFFGVLSLVGLILMGAGGGNANGIFQRIYIFSQIGLVIILLATGRLLGKGI